MAGEPTFTRRRRARPSTGLWWRGGVAGRCSRGLWSTSNDTGSVRAGSSARCWWEWNGSAGTLGHVGLLSDGKRERGLLIYCCRKAVFWTRVAQYFSECVLSATISGGAPHGARATLADPARSSLAVVDPSYQAGREASVAQRFSAGCSECEGRAASERHVLAAGAAQPDTGLLRAVARQGSAGARVRLFTPAQCPQRRAQVMIGNGTGRRELRGHVGLLSESGGALFYFRRKADFGTQLAQHFSENLLSATIMVAAPRGATVRPQNGRAQVRYGRPRISSHHQRRDRAPVTP